MKVFYISSRLNVPDGSSVHGRAFVASVKKLGHEIETYPEITDLPEVVSKKGEVKKDILYYIKRLRLKVLFGRLKRIGPNTADAIKFLEGMTQSVKDFIKMRALVNEFHPDIIVYRKYLFNFSAVWLAKTSGIPCVAEINSLNIAESRLERGKRRSSAFSHWAEKYPLKRSNHVFCVSEAIKNVLATFLTGDKISVIPNGVDADVFDRERFNSLEIKHDLGLEGKLVLGYAGSYQAWHDVKKSVEVIEQLHEMDNAYHLLLIGNGKEYSRIKEYIDSRNLSDCVTQVDYVYHADMPRYLAAFDVAIMTYPVFDGFYFSPLKMYEYMAMSIPVVSTDIGQIGDVIENGKTGALVVDPTTDEFVEAIKSVTVPREKLMDMGATARYTAIEKHSWLVNAREVMDLCNSLLEKN